MPARAEVPNNSAAQHGGISGVPGKRRDPAVERRSAPQAPVWGGSPPGSIYDYIRVASFSLGPDGRINQWSERAAEFFGTSAEDAIGKDPLTDFVPSELSGRGHGVL